MSLQENGLRHMSGQDATHQESPVSNIAGYL